MHVLEGIKVLADAGFSKNSQKCRVATQKDEKESLTLRKKR
nr:hypothetical protein [Wolbachia endosymbiont of Oedothorax gibbosus]